MSLVTVAGCRQPNETSCSVFRTSLGQKNAFELKFTVCSALGLRMSIFESLAGRAIRSGVAASVQSLRGHAITITSPSPQETLSGGEISGINRYFPSEVH
jgi:hypothetical protein